MVSVCKQGRQRLRPRWKALQTCSLPIGHPCQTNKIDEEHERHFLDASSELHGRKSSPNQTCHAMEVRLYQSSLAYPIGRMIGNEAARPSTDHRHLKFQEEGNCTLVLPRNGETFHRGHEDDRASARPPPRPAIGQHRGWSEMSVGRL